jgi:hypothetical protein
MVEDDPNDWLSLNVSYSRCIKIQIICVYCATVLRTAGVNRFSKILGAISKFWLPEQ